MLLFGRILSIAPVKIIFLLSISIFELGSLFCAVAPSIEFLIFGRAIAGVGGAGLWISIMSVLAQVKEEYSASRGLYTDMCGHFPGRSPQSSRDL